MKNFLIVVDMQNDFISGALKNPEAEKIIPKIKSRIIQAKKDGEEVVFTMDTHFPPGGIGIPYEETLEGKMLPTPHCLLHTWGWEIHPELKSYAENTIAKNTFGSMDWKGYILYLLSKDGKGEKLGEIELCGTCTDICIISNALLLRAMYPNVTITVNSSLCAGVSLQKHESALDVMESCQINIIR